MSVDSAGEPSLPADSQLKRDMPLVPADSIAGRALVVVIAIMTFLACLTAGGALLIAEKLLDEDKTGPRWATMQTLGMLLYTEGKERTLSEYKSLLNQVGFADVKGATTPSPLDAVLALKP